MDVTTPISWLVSEGRQSPLVIVCSVTVCVLVFVGVRVIVGVGDVVDVRVGVMVLVSFGIVVDVMVSSNVGVGVQVGVPVGTRVDSFASNSGAEPLEQAVSRKISTVMTIAILFKIPPMFYLC